MPKDARNLDENLLGPDDDEDFDDDFLDYGDDDCSCDLCRGIDHFDGYFDDEFDEDLNEDDEEDFPSAL